MGPRPLAHGVHLDQGTQRLKFPQAVLGVPPEVVLQAQLVHDACLSPSFT
jgi:hypothetical protein